MRREMKRKGFTLVELLIVIVVIGILSAMMMLSSTEAVTSAKVNNIVSNLRNLKTAALAFYVDNMDGVAEGTITDAKLNDEDGNVWTYLGASEIPDKKFYKVHILEKSGNDVGAWYITCKVGKDGNDTGVGTTAREIAAIKSKLKGRAKSLGLEQATSGTSVTVGTEYTNGDYVALKVR